MTIPPGPYRDDKVIPIAQPDPRAENYLYGFPGDHNFASWVLALIVALAFATLCSVEIAWYEQSAQEAESR